MNQFPELQGSIYGEESNIFTNNEDASITVEVKENPIATANHLRTLMNENVSAATLLANIVHKDVAIATDADENLKGLDIKIAIKDLGIWIDPIDGTAEYISRSPGKSERGILSKGLPCATVLIGVFDKHKGQALAGVINQPFSSYNETNKTWTGQNIWGLVENLSLPANQLINSSPVNNLPLNASLSDDNKPLTVVISTSEDNELKEKLKTSGILIHEIAAVGFKLLKVIDETVNVYLLSKGSSFKWDTCAAHGILRSMGGGVVCFQKAVQVVRECGFSDGDILMEKLIDSQLLYHKPDDEFPEPGKRWSNSGGLIAFRNYKDLFIILKALIG